MIRPRTWTLYLLKDRGIFQVGSLSDKLACHKVAVVMCCLLSAAGHIGVKFIPLAFPNTNHTHNETYDGYAWDTDFSIPTLDIMKSIPTSQEDFFSSLFVCVFVLEIVAYGIAEPAAGVSDALTYELLGEDRRGNKIMYFSLFSIIQRDKIIKLLQKDLKSVI